MASSGPLDRRPGASLTGRLSPTLLAIAAVLAGLAAAAVAIGGSLGAAALAGAIAFVAAVVGFRRAPHIMAVVIVGGFALQPSLVFFASPYFGPAKDAVVIAGVLAAAWLPLARRRGEAREHDAWLLVGILVLIGMYLINAAGVHDAAWSNGSRLVAEALGLFIVGYVGPQSRRTWRWGATALLAVAVLNTGVAVAQQAIGANRLVTDFGYAFGDQVRRTAAGQFRSFGTFNDPFYFAEFLMVALVWASLGRRIRFRAPLIIILVAGIGLSFVRTELGLIVGLASLVLVRARRTPSAVAVGLAAMIAVLGYLTVFAAPRDPAGGSSGSFLLTVNGRSQGWGEILSTPDTLVAGRGVGAAGSGLARSQSSGVYQPARFRPGQAPVAAQVGDLRSIDSSYLATLSDIGLAGLALLVAVLLRVAVKLRSGLRQGTEAAWVTLGLWLVIVVDAGTRSSLTSFPFGFIALYLLGLSLARHEAESIPGADDRLPVAHAGPHRRSA